MWEETKTGFFNPTGNYEYKIPGFLKLQITDVKAAEHLNVPFGYLAAVYVGDQPRLRYFDDLQEAQKWAVDTAKEILTTALKSLEATDGEDNTAKDDEKAS